MTARWWQSPMVVGVAALAALLVLFNTVVIVPETRQAVVLNFEQPVRTLNAWRPGEQFGHTGAGLYLKWPLVERVVWVDKRMLSIPLENQPVLSTDQLPLQVDAFARFRIVDPLRTVTTAGSEARVADQLQPILRGALRSELGKRPFAALLSPERGQVMRNIQNGLQRVAVQYGVQIVDVRISSAELPDGAPLDSAFERMRTARQQEAANIQAQGQKTARIIQADAQAQAARIYAASFGKDPSFYDFFRAMQSYRTALVPQPGGQAGAPSGGTTFLLSPQNGYLRQFQAGGGQ